MVVKYRRMLNLLGLVYNRVYAILRIGQILTPARLEDTFTFGPAIAIPKEGEGSLTEQFGPSTSYPYSPTAA